MIPKLHAFPHLHIRYNVRILGGHVVLGVFVLDKLAHDMTGGISSGAGAAAVKAARVRTEKRDITESRDTESRI